MDLFKLLGTIAINNSDANRAIGETTQKAGNFGTKVKGIFSKVGSASMACGKVLITSLGAATTAVGGLTIKSLGLLGELEQNLGGSEQVFGEYAEGIKEQSKSAYRQMGLSQTQFLQTANKMGALFQGSGIDMQKSAEMATETMLRAADVASIMGVDADVAMEAIEGMAKGNFTMMDNLGVAMNDTTLEAYAMSKGFTGTWKDLTTGEKVLWAQQYFMEQTAYATGNYAKENETLAGSLSTAKAALTNFLSGSGTADDVVDSFMGAANAIIKSLDTLLPHLVSGIKTIIKKLTPQLPVILKAALPGIISAAVALIAGLAEVLPDLVEIIADEIPYVMSELGAALAVAFPALLQAVQSIFERIDFTALGEWFGKAVVNLINGLPAFFGKIGNGLEWAWETILYPFIKGIFKIVFGKELPEWEDVKKDLEELWQSVVDWWNDFTHPLTIALGNAGTYQNNVTETTKKIGLPAQTFVQNPDSNYNFGAAFGWLFGSHATGLDRVPYNEYPALLHRNEAVLTASEASAWRSGTLGGDLSRVEAGLNQVTALLAQIVGNTGAGNSIVLDSGALVGQLLPQIDSGMSTLAGRRRRG